MSINYIHNWTFVTFVSKARDTCNQATYVHQNLPTRASPKIKESAADACPSVWALRSRFPATIVASDGRIGRSVGPPKLCKWLLRMLLLRRRRRHAPLTHQEVSEHEHERHARQTARWTDDGRESCAPLLVSAIASQLISYSFRESSWTWLRMDPFPYSLEFAAQDLIN